MGGSSDSRRRELAAARERLPHGAADARNVLGQIQIHGTFRDLPTLLPFLFPTRTSRFSALFHPRLHSEVAGLRRTAESAAADVVARMSAADVARLELLVPRSQYRLSSSDDLAAWFTLNLSCLDKLPRGQRERAAALSILSMHPNGFVRELAVERLAEEAGPGTMAFVLIRANDWVEQVRHVALRAAARVVSERDIAAVLSSAPLLGKLLEYRRVDHTELVKSLRTVIIDEAGGQALLSALRNPDRHIRRALTHLAENATLGVYLDAVDLAARDPDFVVRLWAARQLPSLEERAPERASHLRDVFHAESPAAIRLLALYSELRCDELRALELLPTYLFSPSHGLRRAARYYLKTLTKDTPDAWTDERILSLYRRSLSARPDARLGAVAGLGEVGTREDAASLLPLIDSGRGKIRAAALRTGVMLDPDFDRATLLGLLGDPQLRVAKEAGRLIGGRLRPSDLNAITQLAASDHDDSRARFLTNLIDRLPAWERFIALLETAADPGSPAILSAALWRLERWLAPVHLDTPLLGTRERVTEAFIAARGRLPNEVARRLSDQEIPFGGGPVIQL